MAEMLMRRGDDFLDRPTSSPTRRDRTGSPSAPLVGSIAGEQL